MKKIISLLLCGAMLLAGVSVGASENLIVNTVRVNIGGGTVTVNDEPVELSVPPYINEKGDTVIEMYPLVEALGGSVNAEGEKITVDFDGVEIVYTINSADVSVGEQIIPMNSPVKDVDGIVVAPLRFVSEALGADVTYDGEKGEIVIVSMGEMDEGVNYKLLFKYSGKTKVGNSEELWRFSKPDDFDMSGEDYDMGYYEFSMGDIYVSMSCEDKTDESSLDYSYVTMQEMDSDYNRVVMYDKQKGERGGVPFCCVKYRTLDTITEYYAYEGEKFMYYIVIERTFDIFSGAKDNAEVNSFIDSLEFNYTGGDEENTVDIAGISGVSEEEKTEYTDGNFRWSVKLNGEWKAEEYYGFYNKVRITRPTGIEFEDEYEEYMAVTPVITISSYSAVNGQSVQSWAEKKNEEYKQTVNTGIYSVSGVNTVSIGNLQAKCFEVTYKAEENEYVEKYYYLSDGKYRYEITLSYDKREEEDESFASGARELIYSFIPGDVNPDEAGEVLEPDGMISLVGVYNDFRGEMYNVSYPCTWEVTETDGGLSIMSDGSDMLGIEVLKMPLVYYNDDLSETYLTAEAYLKKTVAEALNSITSTEKIALVSGVEQVDVMGKQGYNAEVSMSAYGEKMYMTLYVIPCDEKEAICITEYCMDSIRGSIYEKEADYVIKSLRLAE